MKKGRIGKEWARPLTNKFCLAANHVISPEYLAGLRVHGEGAPDLHSM